MRGATCVLRTQRKSIPNFNPRTPCGVRRLWGKHSKKRCSFQSAHPMRGATRTILQNNPLFRISIRAPHAGCDPTAEAGGFSLRYFNPRTPCGVRLLVLILMSSGFRISIRAPHAGCDLRGANRRQKRDISIRAPHAGCDCEIEGDKTMSRISIRAPHAGCDRQPHLRRRGSQHFNPRTPCGVRPTRCSVT